MTSATPGCVSSFPGPFIFPGPCARRRLGRRRGAERRVGHRCLSEHSERVSMGGRSRPTAFSRSADRPGDFLAFPFLVGQKRDSQPGNSQIRRSRTRRSPDRRVSAIHATVGDGLSSDGKRPFVIRNRRHGLRSACYAGRFTGRTTSETLPLTLDTVLSCSTLISSLPVAAEFHRYLLERNCLFLASYLRVIIFELDAPDR